MPRFYAPNGQSPHLWYTLYMCSKYLRAVLSMCLRSTELMRFNTKRSSAVLMNEARDLPPVGLNGMQRA